MQPDTAKCIGCGQPAGFTTPTGHPICDQCANREPTLSDILDRLSAFISRYIRFTSDHQLVAVVLWAAHTHLADRLRTTPYLHVTSPEPESGKSQLLDVLEMVVFNPWLVVMPSSAVLYRKIDRAQKDGGLTLLLDEVDPVFKRGGDDAAEALRAVLNAGHTQGRTVPRCVGPSQKLVDFAVYGPKVIAGLGNVPDTIASRSIRIEMKRRKPSERVEPLFPDEIMMEAKGLSDELLSRVGSLDLRHLRVLRRELLGLGLGDRAADGWSSLVAIADEAGGSWMMWARDAAQGLSRKQTTDSDAIGIQLLADSQVVLADWPHEHVFSSDLRAKLLDLEDAPWSTFFAGDPISQRKIALMLGGYDVRSGTRRIDGETKKGYALSDLQDAFSRYLPPASVTPVTSQSVAGETPDLQASQRDDVTDSESPVSSTTTRDVTDVTDEMQDRRGDGAESTLEDAYQLMVDAFDAEGVS